MDAKWPFLCILFIELWSKCYDSFWHCGNNFLSCRRPAQFPSTFIQVAGINAISLGSSTLHCAVPIRSMLCPFAGLAASMVIPEASAKRSILLLMMEKRQEDASLFRWIWFVPWNLYVFLTGKNSIHLYLNGNSEPNLPEAIKKLLKLIIKHHFFCWGQESTLSFLHHCWWGNWVDDIRYSLHGVLGFPELGWLTLPTRRIASCCLRYTRYKCYSQLIAHTSKTCPPNFTNSSSA